MFKIPFPNRTLPVLIAILAMATSALPTHHATAALPPVERIVVYKSRQVMQLLSGKEVVRSYKVALGRNPLGRKQMAGDCRTPEGCYVIDRHKKDSGYYKSLHISYPNSLDLAMAKKRGFSPGGEIMIHGLPKGFEDLA